MKESQQIQAFSPFLRTQKKPYKILESPQKPIPLNIDHCADYIDFEEIKDEKTSLIVRAFSAAAKWIVCRIEQEANKAQKRKKWTAIRTEVLNENKRTLKMNGICSRNKQTSNTQIQFNGNVNGNVYIKINK